MHGELYIAEMMGGGAALFDYDADGDLDVYVTQGGRLKREPAAETPGDRLFRNDLGERAGGGALPVFVDVTATSGIEARGYGIGVAAGDVDNDGFVDLYVNNLGSNQLWRNRGDGTFEDRTSISGTDDVRWSAAAAFLDYDRDGLLDLFVGNYIDFRLANHRKCLAASGLWDYCGPLAYSPEPDRLFRNRGDGTFEDATLRAGLRDVFGNALGAIPADVDADGWIDLYVANDGMDNQLWINRGDGTFENRAMISGCAVNAEGQPEASMGVDAGDFDGDGDEDLFMTHLRRETNTLYLNRGDGSFEDGTVRTGLGQASWDYTGFGSGWLDYDNDGRLDLIAVNGAVRQLEALVQAGDPFPIHQPNLLFRNLGDARFEDVTDRAGSVFTLSEVSRGAAFGDVDNDGDVDVVIVNNGGALRLLINEVGHDRSWVGLRLVDGSGRDALGAWVGVVPAGASPRWRRVRTAGSYASSHDPRVLVGLGDAASVERVEVVWPDGVRETFDGPPVGRYTELRQGGGVRARS
jgi:hypothetical protein